MQGLGWVRRMASERVCYWSKTRRRTKTLWCSTRSLWFCSDTRIARLGNKSRLTAISTRSRTISLIKFLSIKQSIIKWKPFALIRLTIGKAPRTPPLAKLSSTISNQLAICSLRTKARAQNCKQPQILEPKSNCNSRRIRCYFNSISSNSMARTTDTKWRTPYATSSTKCQNRLCNSPQKLCDTSSNKFPQLTKHLRRFTIKM